MPVMNPGRTLPYIPNIMPFGRQFPPSPPMGLRRSLHQSRSTLGMCPPIMAVGIGVTDALRSQVYLAPLCVQRQMELDSCPWALQWVFPKVTFQTQLQLVGLKAWTCGREHERQVLRLSRRP